MSSARRRSAWAGSVAGPIAAALLVASPALAAVATDDQTQLVRVTQSSTDASTGWIEQAYDCTVDEPFTTPNQDYVFGPGTPTLGAGSHVLRTGQYGEETELFRTAQYDGTTASEISRLSYATWASSTKASDTTKKEPAYLRLSFDTDGNGTPDTFLYYEPSISNVTTDDTWQNWNTLGSGQQWSNGGGQAPSDLTSFQDFAAAHPDATIANNGNGGGVALIAGCSGQNQENGLFGVDRFAISTASKSDLTDFDPAVNPVVSNVTVTDQNPDGWNAAAYNDVSDITPNQSMAFGPGNPLGIGSHRMTLGNDPNEVQLWRSPELDGINVGDIRTLNYSTYEKPGPNSTGLQQPAYMRLSVDPGDGSGQINLFYEPSINHPADIQNGAWQTWNTAKELWSTDGGPDNLTTLAAISAKHPNATVYTPANAAGNGGLALIAGGVGDTQLNSDFYVDNVETDYFHGPQADTDRTFDFEPTVPAPSIDLPKVVTGRTNIAITGDTHTGVAAPVALFEKSFGQSDFTKVAQTNAASDGTYVFHRTVSKQSSFFVRSYDRTNSVTKTVKVRVAVTLTLSSPHEGKVRMAVTTSPRVPGQTVRFFQRNADGSHTWLATRTTGPHGGALAVVKAPSGHRITVYATVTAPAGNLKGHSADETIRVT